MRLHALAIGQADTFILELPSGHLAVIDFGHAQLLDYLDVLDPRRERRFAFCLLTHVHNDHYACIEEFIRRHDRRVDEYWFSFASTSGIRALEAFKQAALHKRRGRLLVLDEPQIRSRPSSKMLWRAVSSYWSSRGPRSSGPRSARSRVRAMLRRWRSCE